MSKIIVIDSNIEKELNPILDNLGIDIETVVKMSLKRIVREKSISFITAPINAPIPNETPTPSQVVVEDRITKAQAISLFKAQGVQFNKNVTFASKNRSAYNYWANPYFFALNSDWYLILNDWIKRELHLMIIPAKSISAKQMVCRIDQQDKIDLQICYNDPTFTDTRSKISFAKYLHKSIPY